jgi:hypothetical protein
MMESLVILYGDTGTVDAAGDNGDAAGVRRRQAICVELAKRQATALSAELTEQIERRLVDLRERLASAERLSSSDPSRAAAMYGAIIELHQDDAWAEAVVGEARRRQAALDVKRKKDD